MLQSTEPNDFSARTMALRMSWTPLILLMDICYRSLILRLRQVSNIPVRYHENDSHTNLSASKSWPIVQEYLNYFIDNGNNKKIYLSQVR
jgi:hypothetical protein